MILASSCSGYDQPYPYPRMEKTSTYGAMDAISAIEIAMSEYPSHTTMYVYRRPERPPLPRPNATVPRMASHVNIRTIAKPSMLTEPKFRYSCFSHLKVSRVRPRTLKSCCLPNLRMASRSEAVPTSFTDGTASSVSMAVSAWERKNFSVIFGFQYVKRSNVAMTIISVYL